MAKPTFYPDWATDDVNLPSTGKINKVRPREIIRRTGWDKGQIPTAEEVNWTFNNWGLWIRYFNEEFIPTLPNLYLPKNGTSIGFQGDLSGTITWTGGNQATGNVQVLDNSHGHIGDNITDATNLPTPSKIVKRDSDGGAGFRRDVAIHTDGANADLWMRRSSDGYNSVGLNYSQSTDLFQIYYIGNNGTDVKSLLQMLPGVIQLTNPRTLSGQEGQPNSLVRFDYYWQNLTNTNNNVTNVNNDLQNYKNGAYSTFIAGIRQSGEIGLDNSNFTDYSNGRKATAPGGAFMTAVADVSTGKRYIEDIDQIFYKYQQYAIGGNWYNQGSL